jgi:hypothetical protein
VIEGDLAEAQARVRCIRKIVLRARIWLNAKQHRNTTAVRQAEQELVAAILSFEELVPKGGIAGEDSES